MRIDTHGKSGCANEMVLYADRMVSQRGQQSEMSDGGILVRNWCPHSVESKADARMLIVTGS
jgi:hypothetical protein